MRLINELEPEPRGIYCGAIGVVQPGGAATFNVPIRTLALRDDGATTHVRCGIGSGITADATAAGEWDEWRHKRAFVDRASQAFELLETLRLEEGVFVDVEAHLARMAEAAAHFAFASPLAAARASLAELRAAHRERPLARAPARGSRGRRARAGLRARAHAGARARAAGAIARSAGSDGEFVRFKTTQRAHYDAFAPADDAVFDTLLWNERGELTEFTRGNVALRIDGRWLTPALRHAACCPASPARGCCARARSRRRS